MAVLVKELELLRGGERPVGTQVESVATKTQPRTQRSTHGVKGGLVFRDPNGILLIPPPLPVFFSMAPDRDRDPFSPKVDLPASLPQVPRWRKGFRKLAELIWTLLSLWHLLLPSALCSVFGGWLGETKMKLGTLEPAEVKFVWFGDTGPAVHLPSFYFHFCSFLFVRKMRER